MNVHSASSARVRSLVLLSALAGSGCVSHTHIVGVGATGTGTQSSRQFYFLFGFFQVNEVDAQRIAGELTSYTIETEYGFLDLLMAPLLLPLTATSRTVTVRT